MILPFFLRQKLRLCFYFLRSSKFKCQKRFISRIQNLLHQFCQIYQTVRHVLHQHYLSRLLWCLIKSDAVSRHVFFCTAKKVIFWSLNTKWQLGHFESWDYYYTAAAPCVSVRRKVPCDLKKIAVPSIDELNQVFSH